MGRHARWVRLVGWVALAGGVLIGAAAGSASAGGVQGVVFGGPSAGPGSPECWADAENDGSSPANGFYADTYRESSGSVCGVLSVRIHEYLNGSPGIYQWLSWHNSVSGAWKVSTTSSSGFNYSDHGVISRKYTRSLPA